MIAPRVTYQTIISCSIETSLLLCLLLTTTATTTNTTVLQSLGYHQYQLLVNTARKINKYIYYTTTTLCRLSLLRHHSAVYLLLPALSLLFFSVFPPPLPRSLCHYYYCVYRIVFRSIRFFLLVYPLFLSASFSPYYFLPSLHSSSSGLSVQL